jgi:uncharacterized protein (TIGR00251 family)
LPYCTDAPDGAGVILAIHVIPRARKTEIAGTRAGADGEALLVRLNAPPVDDAANDALVAFLAERLQLPRRAVQIAAGERGRRKRVAIAGVTADRVRAALQ